MIELTGLQFFLIVVGTAFIGGVVGFFIGYGEASSHGE